MTIANSVHNFVQINVSMLISIPLQNKVSFVSSQRATWLAGRLAGRLASLSVEIPYDENRLVFEASLKKRHN